MLNTGCEQITLEIPDDLWARNNYESALYSHGLTFLNVIYWVVQKDGTSIHFHGQTDK